MPVRAQQPSLEQLLEPFETEEFMSRFYSTEFVYVCGPSHKFSHLFSWSELNRVLHEHRLAPPRLLLFKGGRQLEPRSYLQLDRGTREFVLAPGPLRDQLADGATLVLNNVDETYAPLAEAMATIEQRLRVRVHANLYASWRVENGFRLHWDDTDTFIAQVSGSKKWTVFRPTLAAPVRDAEPIPQPVGEPVWDDVLREGSLLYVPRGWWHLVTPTNVPSLHLTITLQKAVGTTFLHWVVEQLKSVDVCRTDIPYCFGDSALRHFADRIASAVTSGISVEALETFVQRTLETTRHRQPLNLPSLSNEQELTVNIANAGK
jgi:ribosomal protein L16 Arg81 hydroxylase